MSTGSKRIFWIGVAITLLGGALWGVSGTSVQYLTTTGGASPALITFLRTLLGGGLFFAFLLVTKRRVVKAMFSRPRNIGALLAFGFALYANQLSYAQTVQITNAGTATVLQMLASAFVMLYVCVTLRRPPRARELIGLLLALLAALFIATQGDIRTLDMPLDGLVWGLLTALSTAVYIIVPKRFGLFERYGSMPVVGTGMLLGALFALPVYLLQGNSLADAAVTLASFGAFEWAIFLVGLVVIGTICGYGFYMHGVSIVGSVKGSLLGAIEPVSATVLVALWLGTAFTGYDVAGMVLMCIMVACVTSDEDDANPPTPPHERGASTGPDAPST